MVGVAVGERDRMEQESQQFHQRVRAAFVALADRDPDHYLILDARAPVEEIHSAVLARLEPLLTQAVAG